MNTVTQPMAHGPSAASHSLPLVMGLRLGCLVAFLLAFAAQTPGDRVARYALLALAYVFAVPYALWFRTAGFSERASQLQLILDLGVITAFALLAGGVGSGLFLLYPLVIFSAAVVLPLRRAVEVGLACVVAYVGVLLMPQTGWLVAAARPAHAMEAWRAVGACTGVFALFLGAGWFVAHRCGYLDERTAQFRRLAEILFKNMPAGLLLLDREGRITLANPRACEMFRDTEKGMQGKRLASLLGGTQRLADEGPETSASFSAALFRRADGSSFPAHVHADLLSLTGGSGPTDFQVVTVHDVTRLLERQQQARDSERLRTAATLATHIAHEVRNPVAAISGSAQVLEALERKSRTGDTESDALLDSERTRLFDCIVAESHRLDEIIAKFQSFADFSDEKLRMLLQLSELDQPPRTAVHADAGAADRP